MTPDTIYAVASGAPPAAIAVLRISGPAAMSAAMMLTGGSLPEPRRAVLRALRHPVDRALLDRALLLCFKGPASATGEDLVELHLHGGRAVVAAVQAALADIAGLRPAEAGEFTRRALMAGRIDLAEAEGLADLLSAETEGQRRAALAVAEGAVSRSVAGWAERLLMISALVEAALDFSDEDDVDQASILPVRDLIAELSEDIGRTLSTPPVERLHRGIKLVLAGAPNTGKSTLFNALVDRDAAIVSPIAGTTRDRIDAAVIRQGVAYVLSDTAGLVESSLDPIETIGVARAHLAMAEADILLWLDEMPPPEGIAALWVWPRADVRPDIPTGRIGVSGFTGDGLPALWQAIGERAGLLLPQPDSVALNERQRSLISLCLEALEGSVSDDDVIILAERLRLARSALDRVTGAVGVEDVLDALFGRFCIGK